MNSENLTTVESLDQFLQGNQAIAFSVLEDKTERHKDNLDRHSSIDNIPLPT
jgi:hypothetical protein